MTPEQERICRWVAFGVATVALVCSISTIILIQKMGKWNGYHIIICNLTIAQIMYDVNYMLGAFPGGAICRSWQFLDVVGGLSTTLWSNILGYCVLFVAMKIKSANIKEKFPKFFAIAFMFPLGVGILQLSLGVIQYDYSAGECTYKESDAGYTVRGLYYWSRIVSILFNILVYVLITLKINNMVVSARGDKYDALSELASRMKYYPLFQALSRSGAAWDEFNRAGDSGYFPSSLMRSICSPASGIAYFAIFVMMQPGMQPYLKKLFRKWCCWCSSFMNSDDSYFAHVLRKNSVAAGMRVSLAQSGGRSDGERLANNADGTPGTMASVEDRFYDVNTLDEDELESIITFGTGEGMSSRGASRNISATA